MAGFLNWRPGAAAAALTAAILVFSAAGLGNLATMPNIPVWYAGLQKPSFTPPNWLFGPVWTLLYAMMAYALFRVLRHPPGVKRSRAIFLFLVQLALNASWSFAFFAARNPGLGLVVIAFLWLAILATIAGFLRLEKTAGLLLAPYLLWVSYAVALNTSIWMLN